MAQIEVVRAVPIEEAALSVEELARACAVEPDWVVQRVRTGVLEPGAAAQVEWRFTSAELGRARRLAEVERAFEADPDLAALVVDLADEVRRLRARLRVSGLG
jgi:chaperone modulatory protein CbpM